MSIRELDMDEGEEILPSSDMHFNPRLELKATAFLDSLLGKLTEAENKKRVRATEMKRRILSCILANLVKAKGSPIIVLLGKTKKYGDFSQDILIRAIIAKSVHMFSVGRAAIHTSWPTNLPVDLPAVCRPAASG
jgi:hypothetical protein